MSVGIVEIRMVENIEYLRPELEETAFIYGEFLVDRKVPLVEPGTAADTALSTDIKVTQLRILKVVRVEPESAVGLWVKFLERGYLLGRFGAKKEDAGN